eukprot:CAMPEP_0181397748 /NCGR_PEP_ID=MMETSP1110-20121109/658_1 /TAXON_ID=174948 /ORGANISM="Symbiodinium sp., Strain CCMP421" /LENGTH=161 /DNA_ID=CAMNT_0023519623 /DNA_START=270 /DNA_END=756 /DNA_ORIENTATION=+
MKKGTAPSDWPPSAEAAPPQSVKAISTIGFLNETKNVTPVQVPDVLHLQINFEQSLREVWIEGSKLGETIGKRLGAAMTPDLQAMYTSCPRREEHSKLYSRQALEKTLNSSCFPGSFLVPCVPMTSKLLPPIAQHLSPGGCRRECSARRHPSKSAGCNLAA